MDSTKTFSARNRHLPTPNRHHRRRKPNPILIKNLFNSLHRNTLSGAWTNFVLIYPDQDFEIDAFFSEFREVEFYGF